MTYPTLTAAKDHVVTTLGSELPNVMTESQVFALNVASLFEVDANGEPTAIPLGQSGPFVVEIDSEEILCSSFANGQTGVYFDGTTDGRGYNSTTIAAHNPNAGARVLSSSVQSVLSTQSGGGGGLPAWFQSGAGDPTTENPTVPFIEGALYFDTENGGLYMSPDGTVWVGLSAPGANEGGLVINADFSLFNPAGTVGIASYSYNGSLQIATENGGISLFINDGAPSGSVTPQEIGDLCIDTSTPALWQATGTEDTDWSQIGGGSGPSGTSYQSFITEDVSDSDNFVNVTSLDLPAGTYLLIGQWTINVSGLTGTGYAVCSFGPNSASATGAYAGTNAAPNAAGSEAIVAVTLTHIVTLTETTTVYMNFKANDSDMAVVAADESTSTPNASGLIAIPVPALS